MTNRKPDQNHENPVNPAGTSEDDSLISVTEEETIIRPDTVDDIDDFAKALLNQRVEMALYPNGKEQKKPAAPPKEMSLEEAESTMSYALDQLRRERGQLPIETEEENFEWQQLRNFGPEPEEEVLTTESIIQERKDAQNTTLTALYDAKPETVSAQKDKSEYFEKTETREESRRHDKAARKKHKSQKSSAQKKDHKPAEGSEKKAAPQKSAPANQAAQSSRKKEPEAAREIPSDPRKKTEAELFNFKPAPEMEPAPAPKPRMKKKVVWIIVLLVALVLCMFGGYVYKVKVYDPAHTVTEAQEASYKKLQQYADEYEMASDAEKMELLDLDADYNALNESQKKSISEYFKVQTGMDYTELRDSLQKQKEEQKAQNSASYNILLDYVNGWNDLSADEQKQIQDKLSDFNALDEEQKAKIDEIMKQNTGMTFQEQADAQAALPDETDEPADNHTQTNTSTPGLTDEQKEIQGILNQLIADRSSYAEFLAEEGMDYDDVMAEYDSKIAYYQNLLNNGQ